MKLSLIFFRFILLSSYLLISTSLYATNDVWAILRNHFTLNHHIDHPEVKAQLRWLLSHPHYLQHLSQSRPYIYYIINEIKQRKMPGELALLPMIESSYNPFAYSWVGAAGLWQLMPNTSNDLGLKRDWWYDARRGICSSTEAALNYLTYLNRNLNGNWLFAIAAYDAGQGTILRAIKNTEQPIQKIEFWSLNVPRETKLYVPRLLAMAEIINHPDRYQIKLPPIPYTPYFKEVNVGSQIDLNHAAQMAEISYQELLKLNPGYNRWTTPPYKPYKLLIPITNLAQFNENLLKMPKEKRTSWCRYQVRFADNLASIARQHLTTVSLLKEINQLTSTRLKEGQFILIPNKKNTLINQQLILSSKTSKNKIEDDISKSLASSIYKVVHIVQPNDTYQTLEKKYNISKAEIQQWNNSLQTLQIGQQLTIWKIPKHESKALA